MGPYSCFSGEDTFFCLVSYKKKEEFSLVAVATAPLYTSQNLSMPLAAPSALPVLADILLLLGETSITGNTFFVFFFNRRKALLWSNETLWPDRSGISSPVNLRALFHAQGAVTRRGQGVAPPGDVFP